MYSVPFAPWCGSVTLIMTGSNLACSVCNSTVKALFAYPSGMAFGSWCSIP